MGFYDTPKANVSNIFILKFRLIQISWSHGGRGRRGCGEEEQKREEGVDVHAEYILSIYKYCVCAIFEEVEILKSIS